MTRTHRRPDTLERAKRSYYPILDALRFILAFWVAVGHYRMMPLFGDPHTGPRLWSIFKRGWETIVFGTPAVIVFFVVSGFCIHLPFRGSAKIDVVRYYLRRYTRILIPVAGALLVYSRFRKLTYWGEHSILWESPLWSLACEEIYYALYPVLRRIRNRIGWKWLLPVSFIVGVSIALTHPRALSWHVYGPLGTAMLLLPIWLLGCLLAEQAESLTMNVSTLSIWFWRLLAWLGCWTCEMFHFKVGISYTQTMIWFGVLAYFWLRQELAYAKVHEPNRWLVAAGAWSYSLYLIHADGGGMFEMLGLKLPPLLEWFGVMASSLFFSYLFYLLVERPSHKLARKIKVRTAAPNAVPAGATLSEHPAGTGT